MASVALAAVGAGAGAVAASTVPVLAGSMMTSVLTGAGIGLLAGSQIEAGQAERQVAERNARIAEQNAIVSQETAEYNAMLNEFEAENAERIAEYNAQVHLVNRQDALEAAEYNAALSERESKRQRSRARMRAFASGVTYEGSPLLVDAEDEYIQELNVANILYEGNVEAAKSGNLANLSYYQGAIEAQRFRQKAGLGRRAGGITAQNYLQQSGLQQFAGRTSQQAGFTKGVGTILSGAGRMSSGNLFGMFGFPSSQGQTLSITGG